VLYLLSSFFKLPFFSHSVLITSSFPPIQNAALFRALILTHSWYNITDVIAQLISVLKMEAAGSSKTWVIIHESTLHHHLHYLHTNCNSSVIVVVLVHLFVAT
jgi:hypothetical protein